MTNWGRFWRESKKEHRLGLKKRWRKLKRWASFTLITCELALVARIWRTLVCRKRRKEKSFLSCPHYHSACFLRATRRNFAAATQDPAHRLKPSSHWVESCVEMTKSLFLISHGIFLCLWHTGLFFLLPGTGIYYMFSASSFAQLGGLSVDKLRSISHNPFTKTKGNFAIPISYKSSHFPLDKVMSVLVSSSCKSPSRWQLRSFGGFLCFW